MPDDATSAATLRDLRRARRGRRVEEIDWIDSLYKAYVSLILGVAAVLALSGLVGDARVAAHGVDRVADAGPALVGLGVALAVGGGLRSGSRGGPLAVEPADLHHVLLGPVPRALALRRPALRQLRSVLAVGLLAGAVAGNLAFRRLPGGVVAWLACGAAFGLLVAGAAWGAAALAAGRRWTARSVTVAGAALLAWSGLDVALGVRTSPATWLGALATWPLRSDLLGIAGAVLVVALPVAGVAAIGGVSVEAMTRRAGLVGQLRFAATTQDLRAVIVLHRQLALEAPRARPWLVGRHPQGRVRAPAWRRGWHGILRWPPARVLRVGFLVAVAAAAAVGVWHGTTPLVAVAGGALFVASLDLTEALGQEVDHPALAASLPTPVGSLYVRHLVVPIVAVALPGLVALGVAAAVGASAPVVGVVAATVVAAACAAPAAAGLSVVLGPPPLQSELLLLFPEIVGLGLIARQVLAPALAIAGFVPVAVAAVSQVHGGPFAAVAWRAALPVVGVSAGALVFISTRRVRRF